MIIFLCIIVIIICIVITGISYKNRAQLNTEITRENEKLIAQHNELDNKYRNLYSNYSSMYSNLQSLTKEHQNYLYEKDKIETRIEEEKKHLASIQGTITSTIETQKLISDKAFSNYCDVLDNKYKEVEKDYDNNIKILKESYSNLQLKMLREADTIREDLDKLRSSRAAAVKAQTREKEIKENLSFYCLKISPIDLADIQTLNTIKTKLSNPRILDMLIWQTYYRTPMTNLCNSIIGTTVKTGIYKITNQITNECYIGQAVDLASRWKQHAKHGLSIDTPPGNKLYKAMIEFGIHNFSWEILEECPREQLNEKEKFYIELYQAKDFGYNSVSGNK